MQLPDPYSVQEVDRLVALIGTRLSVGAQPMPWEGLADILFRASCMNGYRSTSVLAKALGIPGYAGLTPEGVVKANLPAIRVANLLGTRGPNDLDHLFNPILEGERSKMNFFGREVTLRGLFAPHRRFAPGCLKLGRYQRAVWSVASLGFDPDTRETLLSRCPECCARLGFDRSVAIGTCEWCYADGKNIELAEHAQPIVVADDEEALSFSLSLINPRIAIEDLEMHRLHRTPESLGPGAVFQLVSGMAECWEYLTLGNRLAEPPSATSLARASRAVLDWPQGMVRFSEEILEKSRMREDPWSLSVAACQYVDTSTRNLIYEAFRGTRHPRRGYARPPSSNTLRAGDTEVVDYIDGKDEPEVAAHRLGIPQPFLPDVLQRGREEADHLRFEESALKLEAELLSAGFHDDPPAVFVTLRQAVSALGGTGGNPWPAVLSALNRRELDAWIQEDERLPLIERLVVNDFRTLEEVLETIQSGEHLSERPLDLHGAAAIMAVSPSKCADWKRAGVLPQSATVQDAWHVHSKFCATGEIKTRVLMRESEHLSLVAIGKRLRRAGCVPVVKASRGALIFLYRRTDVEAVFGAQMMVRLKPIN